MYLRILFVALSAGVLDMVWWGLTATPGGWLTNALFYTLIARHSSRLLICAVGSISLCQIFLMTGSYGMGLTTLALLGALFYYTFKMTDLPGYELIGAVAAATVIQWFLLAGCKGGASFGLQQLVGAFISSATMVYLVPGSQGNRLRK